MEASRLAVPLATLLLAALPAAAQERAPHLRRCPVEPGPGAVISSSGPDGSGGMNSYGWDGIGKNSVTLFWHVEAATPDTGSAQRSALIAALQVWADVVDITFVEATLPNHPGAIDFDFLTGDHSWKEPEEDTPECPFDSCGSKLAHASFPPGAGSTCGGNSMETYSGNVHFDDDCGWEVGDAPAPFDNSYDLLFVAVHEVGHALGLTHSDPPDVMKPTFGDDEMFGGLTGNDVANIQDGYSSGGFGSVITLETLGIWVDPTPNIPMLGTQADPFNFVGLAVAAVPPHSFGVDVHIQTGTYVEGALVMEEHMTLLAEGGNVIIE